MEADATTDTIMTDEVMTEQQPAAAAMETEDDAAPPARLMITKMVRCFFISHAPSQCHDTPFLTISRPPLIQTHRS